MENLKSVYAKDGFMVSIGSEAEFFERLDALMEVQEFIENPITECIIGLLPDAPLLIGTDELPVVNNVVNCSDDKIRETMSGIGLILKTRKIGDYLMRQCAYDSLLQRAGYGCPTIHRHYNERRQTFEEQINSGLTLYGSTAKILVRDGRIAAMMSKDYAPMNQKIIFAESMKILRTRFDEARIKEGFIAETMTSVVIEINTDERLKVDLSELLSKLGATSVKLTLRIETGDTGLSNVRLIPQLYTDNNHLIGIGKKIEIRHIGRNTNESMFLENVKEVCPLFEEIAEQIEKLKEETFFHPVSVLEGLCDKKISSRLTALAIERMVERIGMGQVSGIDLYLSVCDIINIAQEEKEVNNNMDQLNLEDAIGKMILSDWKKLDVKSIKKIKEENTQFSVI